MRTHRSELMEGAAAPDARRAALAAVHFPEQRTLAAADEPCAADDLPSPGAGSAGDMGQGADPVNPGMHRMACCSGGDIHDGSRRDGDSTAGGLAAGARQVQGIFEHPI